MKGRTIIDQALLIAKVEARLAAAGVKHRAIPHAAEGNCERVSALRGNPVHAAAKALLVNVKLSNKQSKYVLVNIPGDKELDLEAMAARYTTPTYKQVKAVMADKLKVAEFLDCEIGRVPPFSFHEAVQVLVDAELVNDNEKVYFSPGSLELSFEVNSADFRDIIVADKGEVAVISKQNAAKQAANAAPAPSAYATGAAPLFAAPAAVAPATQADEPQLSNSNVK